MANLLSKLIFLLFCLWSFTIVFFYGKNFPYAGSYENLVLDELFGGVVFILVCVLSGNRLFRLFRLSSLPMTEELLFSAALGAGIISLSLLILGLLNMFYSWILTTFFILVVTLAITNWSCLKRYKNQIIKNYPSHFSLAETILISLIFGVVILALFNTLTPPFYRDSLIHHLALPKWHLRYHRIVDLPFAIFSYYPPFMEMLYTGALFFGSDILAQLFHYLFYLGCLFFTFLLARKFLSRPLSLLTVLLFGSLPVVFRIASVAYSDFGLTFFTLGGSLALFYWIKTKESNWLTLSAVMVGLAVSCKYNGLIIFLFFIAYILLIMLREKLGGKYLIKNTFLFLLLVFLVNSFWLGKNFFSLGNPIFPLGNKFLGKKPEQIQLPLPPRKIRKILYGESLKDQILLPWNLAVKTKTKVRQELDGVINPIFLIFLPAFFFIPKKSTDIKWITSFCLFYFLSFWASGVIRLRYLMPIYPFLSFLTIYSISSWKDQKKKTLGLILINLSLVLNFYWILPDTIKVNPINFLVGKESRAAFLTRQLPVYPVFEYINHHLPLTARIMLVYGGNFGNDGYYLDRDYYFTYWDQGAGIKDILQKSSTPEEVRLELKRKGITHLLINEHFLKIDFSSSLSPKK
ncbi:MAG: glycosyltransferase family 39 protein, partial [Desulfobacterota bacterium]|nr:glycosyltransferase family 39 protein [Thermodesulfobacteriota bacterium]